MDFLTIIEKALEGSEYEITTITRAESCTADGEEGSLVIVLEDSRVYTIDFRRGL